MENTVRQNKGELWRKKLKWRIWRKEKYSEKENGTFVATWKIIIKILHDIQKENNDDDQRHFETGRP